MSTHAEKIETPAEYSVPEGGVLGEKVPFDHVFETTRETDGTRSVEA
jgi:hypothetical protein